MIAELGPVAGPLLEDGLLSTRQGLLRGRRRHHLGIVVRCDSADEFFLLQLNGAPVGRVRRASVRSTQLNRDHLEIVFEDELPLQTVTAMYRSWAGLVPVK